MSERDAPRSLSVGKRRMDRVDCANGVRYNWHMKERAILWDFDGTLADRPGGLPQCVQDIARRASFITDTELATIHGYVRSAGFPWDEPYTGHPEITTADAWWQ